MEVQSCVFACARQRRLVNVPMHLSAMLSPTVCDSFREPGPGDIPLALRKLSPWDASANEQRSLGGAALLIKAGVVCQCWHMMHSAITVGGKTKHEARLLQPLQQICCLTMEARRLTTATTAVGSGVSITLHCVTQPAIRACTYRAEAYS